MSSSNLWHYLHIKYVIFLFRYDVHKKLVNFMAPYDNQKWTDEAK